MCRKLKEQRKKEQEYNIKRKQEEKNKHRYIMLHAAVANLNSCETMAHKES